MPPRPGSYSQGIAQDFSKTIEYTDKLIGELLEQLRDGQISFTELRTELNQLISNVKDLSHNFRSNEQRANDQNTQIVLLNAKLTSVEIELNKIKEEQRENSKEEKSGKWQMTIALISGGLGLISSVIVAVLSLAH